MSDLISRKSVTDTTICEGISCNECSFNEIDGESGCLLKKRVDELPSVQPMSVIEDIKTEIGNNVEWHFKNHQEDIAQIYSDCLNIIDRYLGKEQE